MNTTTLASTTRPSPAQVARLVLGLFKLRIGVLIMVTALVGLAVTPGASPSLVQVAVLALAVLGASAAAGAFNQYYEAESDRLMARTRGRAFASGALPRSPAWLLLIGALLALSVGAAWQVLNGSAALYIFLGAFFYGVVYTVWLKRRSWTNIVIGGLSGSFAVLAGAAAVNPALGAQPLLLALVLFLWTPPHFWALAIMKKDEYARAGVPMLPVVAGDHATAVQILAYTLILYVVTVVPVPMGTLGIPYLVAALALGGWFTWLAVRLLRDITRDNARATFL
ncbi:MAG: protoheme IX farnesyltransferase, partial [Burkholderiaceae bacterium]